jgi:hypothetical protein
VSFSFPSVDDFKDQFPRDFPYAVPAYGALAHAVLTAGAVSSFVVDDPGQGYKEPPTVVLANAPGDTGAGAAGTATVSGGKVTAIAVSAPGAGYGQAPLVSFTGGAGDETNSKRVTDDDIAGGILDAQFNVNPGLFPSQQMFSRAFLYLAAHEMIEKLRMAAAGVQSQYSWLTVAKSVEGVSQTFEIPLVVSENPFLAALSTTRYGLQYIKIISPLLVGNIHAAETYTNP